MENLRTAWANLDTGRRIIVALAAVAALSVVLFLARGASTPSLTLLYSGLEQQAAGEVIEALEQRGIPHEVRGSGIFVPVAERDSLRMTLAAEGLPANSAQGYELLDTLSGFGTTSQMFDAAYLRAKEGELARTILASPHIRAARVHISTPSGRPFQRQDRPSAAVTVTTSGTMITPQQAQALRYLVASAVSGLDPEDVAVIDGASGLVAGSDEAAGRDAGDRAAELRARAERILEARVGPGNAVVEVALDTVNETEQIIERRVDPDSRVAISTEVEERANNSLDSRNGDVTVASNLPDGDAAPPEGASTSQSTESRALTNYDMSETSREIRRGPGAIRRLTVAILVNETTAIDDTGAPVSTPRSDEELQALRDLVASAVGFDADRGDIITVQSMAFEPVAELGTEAQADPGMALDLMTLIKIGVLAAVALILGLFVVRPILASGARGRAATLAAPAAPMALTTDPVAAGTPLEFARAALDPPGSAEPADPVSRLRRMIEERQDETIQILQSWIEDPDDRRPEERRSV